AGVAHELMNANRSAVVRQLRDERPDVVVERELPFTPEQKDRRRRELLRQRREEKARRRSDRRALLEIGGAERVDVGDHAALHERGRASRSGVSRIGREDGVEPRLEISSVPGWGRHPRPMTRACHGYQRKERGATPYAPASSQ